jgi:hypothetical protein
VRAAVALLKALSAGVSLADVLALAVVEAGDVDADRGAVKSAQVKAAAAKALTGAPATAKGGKGGKGGKR